MKILLAGIMGRYPYGGVLWCSLMYLLGLKALGHEVFYVEDTGECNFDPVLNSLAMEPSYALKTISATLKPFGMSERWSYVDYQGVYHGRPKSEVEAYCADADLFLTLSGGSWFWRDEYKRIPHRIFVDTDPGFTQLAIAQRPPSLKEFFSEFTSLFTFGSNIGTERSRIPTNGFVWNHTWQPIDLSQWEIAKECKRLGVFTTIMTWKIESFTDIGGNKDHEFKKIIDLPQTSKGRFELAVNGPKELLANHGWGCVDALEISKEIECYRRYIAESYAEFSVAKQTYVEHHTGWFSDRSECYLASGRPVVVQDTGFRAALPVDSGILSYRNLEEAKGSIDRVLTDYQKQREAAREVAREYFASDVVLPRLLGVATSAGKR
jgi:hypothetical protein